MIIQLVVALLLLSIWIRERGYDRPVASSPVARSGHGLAAFRRIRPPPSTDELSARIAETLGIPRRRNTISPASAPDLRLLRLACLEIGIAKPPGTVDALLRAIAGKLGLSWGRSRDNLISALSKTFEELEANRRQILDLCSLMRIDGIKSGPELASAIGMALDLDLPDAVGAAELTPILLEHFGQPPSGAMRRDLFALAQRLQLPAPYWIADFGAELADLVQFYRDVANSVGIATIKNPIALLEDCAITAGILSRELPVGLSYRELRSIMASHFDRAGASLASTLEAFLASARYTYLDSS